MNLAKANIETTVIPDSAIYAVLSRVNKVHVNTDKGEVWMCPCLIIDNDALKALI